MAERSTEGPDGALVFHGNILPTMTSLGFTSRQQWHDLKRDLRAMACIRQLRRGARYRLGAWVLLRPPTPELFEEHCRPLPQRVLAAKRDAHDQALIRFILHVKTTHPGQLEAWVAAGIRRPEEVIGWLAALPEKRLRSEFPGVCTGFHGGPHSCMVADLDPLAPSSAAGAATRRRAHLARLAADSEAADQGRGP